MGFFYLFIIFIQKATNMKNKINEELSKSDVSKEMKIYMTSDEFKTKIEKIVKDKLKDNKEIEDKVVEITKNVLTQLFKNLWVKRSMWRDNLSNKAN